MNPKESRAKLGIFLASLPDSVFSALLDKKIELQILPLDIAAEHGLVLYETGNICEGVRRVLAGEDSASNLVAFIQQDERIEEDNRPKIPALAYEIQTKIFDPVLPILKQAGFPIKEGRVAESVVKYEVGSGKYEEAPSRIQNSEFRIQEATNAEQISGARKVAAQDQLDDRHIKALLRIAAGTKYGEEELRETFEDLPPGLRQSLSSVDTANAIQGIAKKYLLHVDQMASLASETGLVLLGLTHPADFIGNLARRLRLKEEDAKAIARDISAEVFVKVRDALRGLHEENPKSEIRNPKQIQNSNIQTKTKLGTTPAVSEYGTPFAKGDTDAIDSSVGLEAKSYQLEAGLDTPYSAGAKWNTGDNILSAQTSKKEGPLSRNEVLRGVENPKSIYENTNYTNQRMATNKIEKYQTIQQDNTELNAKRSPLNASSVGPTGWKPAASPSYENTNYTNIRMATNQKETPLAVQPNPPKPRVPVPTAPPLKARPQSDGAFPPPAQKPEAEDFLDQKLEAPMTLPKVEKRYTTDPYREPLN